MKYKPATIMRFFEWPGTENLCISSNHFFLAILGQSNPVADIKVQHKIQIHLYKKIFLLFFIKLKKSLFGDLNGS
jgi:hypothetical protein